MSNRKEIEKLLASNIQKIGLLPEEMKSDRFDEDILLSGLVDSFGFVQFLMFVEDEFGIEITEEMQFGDQIRSVNGMANLILGVENDR